VEAIDKITEDLDDADKWNNSKISKKHVSKLRGNSLDLFQFKTGTGPKEGKS